MTVVDRFKFAGIGIIAPAALLGLAAFTDASAHICNKVFAVLPTDEYACEEGETYDPPTVSRDGTLTYAQHFKKFGWIKGTNPELGNTHALGGHATLFTFRLDRTSRVTITFAADREEHGSATAQFSGDPVPAVESLRPAFTLYRGVLPNEATDDSAFDPLNPVDESTFAPIVSPVDAAPGDPGIPSFVIDPVTGTYVPNPDFTDEVAEWYDDHYNRRHGRRDTLNFTLTGGRDADGNPVKLYAGQFDALGDWSIATHDAVPGDELTSGGDELESGGWAKLRYITHAKSQGSARRGGWRPAVLSNVVLPRGNYTIAADGANCNDDSPECIGPSVNGKLSFKAVRLHRR